jgi:pyruvate/2-oxoglutarate dehydrogenase complex dihydrolipoamide dehydrogenase (E3) component
VHFAWEADKGSIEIADDVVVIGGGLVGMESALHLCRSGKRVTLVEMLSRAQATANNGIFGIPLASYTAEAGMVGLFESKVTEIRDTSVLVSDCRDGSTREVKAGTVLLAVGLCPRKDKVEELRHAIAEGDVYQVGDLTGGGTIGHATNSAFALAAQI